MRKYGLRALEENQHEMTDVLIIRGSMQFGSLSVTTCHTVQDRLLLQLFNIHVHL